LGKGNSCVEQKHYKKENSFFGILVEKPLRRGSRTVRDFFDITGLKIHLLFSITLETKQKNKNQKVEGT
jgi:hypothetical protein